MNNLKILGDNDNNNLLLELSKYMLYKIDNNENTEFISKENKESEIFKNVNKKINIYSDYNKQKSKYNGELESIKNNFLSDKFFWLYFKLRYNFTDEDLKNINIFSTEKKHKIECIENIKKTKNNPLFKKYKIKKNTIEDDLLNSKSISYNTFKGLCLLYNINIVIIRDNNTYSIISSKLDDIDSLNNLVNSYQHDNKNIDKNIDKIIDIFKKYNIIKLNYCNYSIQENLIIDKSKKKSISFDENTFNVDLKEIFLEYYYIENLEKAIKSPSSYKVDELINIAKKLKLNILNEHGKQKTKNTLYNEIIIKLN